jgi:RNA polymerase sigma-70 factor, ECF subfamily
MSSSEPYPLPVALPASGAAKEQPGATPLKAARLRTLIVEQHAVVWRMLRRFGVSTMRVDEAVSHVFDVMARRLDDIVVGKEQAFLIQVCARVASEFRRGDARRARIEDQSAVEGAYESPSPEELFERHEARALLDEVLEEIEPDARAVFVLHEMEQWTAIRIAESLGIPPGTVASRLRRGREQFERAAAQLRRRLAMKERAP